MKTFNIRSRALRLIALALTALFFFYCSDKPSDCFTWKTEINGSTFYLTGSIHLAKEENYPLQKPYMKSYKKADKVILELESNIEELAQQIFEYGEKDRLEEGQYLNLHLKPETVEKLKEIIYEDELKNYFRHEGWMLNMAIAGAKAKLLGYDPKLALDMYFNGLARKDGKEVIGLDDIKTQMLLFDFEAPLEAQVAVIENAVARMEESAKMEEPLYRAYFGNDYKKFEAEFLKIYDFNNPQIKQAYDLLFTKRNASWAGKLEKLAEGKPATYFVLVGAGHFFGPDNVRELLEQKGHKVEKI